ncbi:MAG: excinuclease ABC subunit UvrB [Lentisphaeraceae bacterium]|nr:excinuclease ABC subunit UvrB [Lentisphaeraceae bacterium]
MNKFKLVSDYQPSGDQPAAIEQLVAGLEQGKTRQTLLGVTGSGKTYTMANVIEKVNRPTLVVSQNKTLAAQLFSEFKHFFPENRVEYFVSYFDYYQPEAYVPQTDTYIAKDSAVNAEIEKYRLSATASLLERRDVIVVASVSCIYGLGSPEAMRTLQIPLAIGDEFSREQLLQNLVDSQYSRNDMAPQRSNFSVRGDIVDIYPSYRDDFIRVEFWGDEIEGITKRECLTSNLIEDLQSTCIYPATHFAAPKDQIAKVIPRILEDMQQQVAQFEREGKLVEAQRIYQRCSYDMEMLRELGYCNGIENYSCYMTGRNVGDRPFTLIDFFPDDYLMVMDESHVSVPQFRGMYNADRSRKLTLVDHGFRLPSALDNRPMNFDEFEDAMNQTVFVSATPADYEKRCDEIVNLVVRPTGLLDPVVEMRPLGNQIDDLLEEIRLVSKKNERIIVTCLTKKTSEDLSDYMRELGIKAKYIHSDIDVIERIDIMKSLREGVIDVLIGINLLREGMDLPEVSLIAILDADKEGFLRSETALIQIAGRAARNVNGRVILYADRVTKSMQKLIDVTDERRATQQAYNEEHGITPTSIVRPVQMGLHLYKKEIEEEDDDEDFLEVAEDGTYYDADNLILKLAKEMQHAAENLEFERAAALRDKIAELRKKKAK